jgi:hypothetical protein
MLTTSRGPKPRGTLAYGSVTIALSSGEAAAAAWLVEVLRPCFAPGEGAASPLADWHVRVSSSGDAYADWRARSRPEAAPRACFALDQEVLALPAWPTDEGVVVADVERSCFLRVGPGRVDLIGDPGTRRWRFTAMWVCHEIAATRLRRTQLDVHAASVEAAGRAILIVGPKGAGKTTLALHLLRSGPWRMMANDRAFVGRDGGTIVVRGMPTAVKVRPPTLAEFPELRRGLPPVERPYLHTLDELAAAKAGAASPEVVEFALSPAQLAHQLGVERCGAAPLGAIVFPDVRADMAGWRAERLTSDEVGRRLFANLYGGAFAGRGATVFEAVDGGRSAPSPALADALARAVPGYRLGLGRGVYAEPGFAGRLREVLLAP